MRFHMTHVTLEFHQVRSKWFPRLRFIRHKMCTYLASGLPLSSNGLNQASTWTSSPRSSIRCVQNDFWVYGMFSTNLQKSCTDTNTISKWTKTRFHMTHVTFEFHRVRPKWFLSLWYVRRKPQTFLASRLALYQMNWIKHPLELRHLGVLSSASKTISEPTVCLAQTMHLSWTDTNTSPNWPKRDSTWPTSPRTTIRCVQNDFLAYGTFGVNRTPILRQD
jgi:hypothetical protein